MSETATRACPLVAEVVTTSCKHCGEQIARGTGGNSTCYGRDGIPVPDGHEPRKIAAREGRQ